MLALPIIGHTDNNKRQDGNLQINFASFASEDWPIGSPMTQYCFRSFAGQYSIEMLQSLGFLFTDKCMKSSGIQKAFIEIEKNSTEKFHPFCCAIYEALKDNHCRSLDELIETNKPNATKTDHTVVDIKLTDSRYVFVRHITLTPLRVILRPLCRELGNRALCLRGVEYYLRVYIREENDEMLDELDIDIRSRFKRKMLTNGIMCMNRTYYCIGSSSSQMKNFSYWFITLNEGESIDQVRAQFGDFHVIKNVATYVARIGLYFSTSTATGVSDMQRIHLLNIECIDQF